MNCGFSDVAAGRLEVEPAIFLDAAVRESSPNLGKLIAVKRLGSLGGLGGPYILLKASLCALPFCNLIDDSQS